jgi:hypothetical protein
MGQSASDAFIAKHCPTMRLDSGDCECLELIEVGNKNVWTTYRFYDRRLVSVRLIFPSQLFPDILEIFNEKLGPPSDIRREGVSTRIGAKYENATVTWLTISGSFTVTKYDGSVSHGHAEIKSPIAFERDEVRRKQAVPALRGKF